MTPEEFVKCCHAEKDAMLARYFDPEQQTAVGTAIAELKLTESDQARLKHIIDDALTDTFFTLLYALDGCASLGGQQRNYQLIDEEGTVLTGELEGLVFERFGSR
jgi:hypothetical protein